MTLRAALLDVLCAQRRQMRLIFGLLIAMGLLLGLSLVVLEPGHESYPILILDTVLVVAGLVFFGGAYRYCAKREMES